MQSTAVHGWNGFLCRKDGDSLICLRLQRLSTLSAEIFDSCDDEKHLRENETGFSCFYSCLSRR